MNDPNVISLGVGEPDFDTPWHIREEGIYSLEKGTYILYIQCRIEGTEGRNQCLSGNANAMLNMILTNEIMVTVGGI